MVTNTGQMCLRHFQWATSLPLSTSRDSSQPITPPHMAQVHSCGPVVVLQRPRIEAPAALPRSLLELSF